jgi:hypothetical protein
MRKLIVSNILSLDGYYEGKDKSLAALLDYFHNDYVGDQQLDLYQSAIAAGNTQLLHMAALAEANHQRNVGRFGNVIEITNHLLSQPNLSSQNRAKVLFNYGITLLRQGKLRDADI